MWQKHAFPMWNDDLSISTDGRLRIPSKSIDHRYLNRTISDYKLDPLYEVLVIASMFNSLHSLSLDTADWHLWPP